MAGRLRSLWLLGVLSTVGDAFAGPGESGAEDPVSLATYPVEGETVSNPVVLSLRLTGLDERFDPRELECRIDSHDATRDLQRALAAFPDELFSQDTETVVVRFPLRLPGGVHDLEFRCPTANLSSVRRIRIEGESYAAAPYDPITDLAEVDLMPPQIEWEVDGRPLEDRHFVPAARPSYRLTAWDDSRSDCRLVFSLDGEVRAQVSSENVLEWQPPEGLAAGRHRATVLAQDRHGNVTVEERHFTLFDRTWRCPWPVGRRGEDHTLGHLAHNFQHYGGRPYFHPGLDVRAAAESPVYAAAGGRVVALRYYGARPLYFEVAIEDDQGFLWEYHHVDEDSVPEVIREAHEEGGKVPAGAHLGDVIRWRVQAYGRRYDHLHVNVLDPWGNYLNPLHFLALPSPDEVPPVIWGLHFCANEDEKAFPAPGGVPVISGDVDVVLHAEDTFGEAPYQLGVYEIQYQIFRLTARERKPMTEPVLFCRFDSLPGGFDRHAGVEDVFKARLKVGSEVLETEGNYSKRRFMYVLTHAPAGRVSGPESFWDTDGFHPDGAPRFPDGKYQIVVAARDISGNTTRRSFDVLVKNGSDAQSK